MSDTLMSFGTAAIALAALDYLWLGLLMSDFYRTQLAPIARMADGAMAPVWPSALLVYVLLAAGIAVFVVPRATTWSGAAAFGALFGMVIYGVYDLTNHATLASWPLAVALVDIAWGTVLCATTAAVTFTVVR